MKAPAICSSKPLRKWNWAKGSRFPFLTGARRVFAALAVVFFVPPANAYLTDSQYHGATEPEHLLLDSYTHWDSEAASDFITYQRPIEWEGMWLRSPRAFDLSIGSISSKQFLNDQRLKLHHMLTERLEVRLHWLETRDFEQDRVALPLELRYRLSERFSVGVFGQPSLYKSEDDVGILAAFRPSAEREIEFAVLWPDFQRNQRNLEDDRWSTAPQAYTLTSTFLPSEGKSDFRRFEAHYEPLSVRSVGDARTQSLSYQMLSFGGLRTFGLGSSIGYRLQMDRAYAEDYSAVLNRVRRRSLNQLEYGWYYGPYLLKPGLNFQYRETRVNSDSEITRDIVPTFWFVFPETARSWGNQAWFLGYDATVFDRDSSLRSDQRAIEHRGNIKSSMRFSKSGELALLFTFDLDRFGSDETWEGGAGQFRFEF